MLRNMGSMMDLKERSQLLDAISKKLDAIQKDVKDVRKSACPMNSGSSADPSNPRRLNAGASRNMHMHT